MGRGQIHVDDSRESVYHTVVSGRKNQRFQLVKMSQPVGVKGRSMPKGPRGEKRPADVVGAAVKVAKIATGEIEDERYVAPGRKKSGLAGARARARTLSKERRSEIARKGAEARWRGNMATQLETAKRRLFDKEALGADNVKFFPGSNRDSTPEQMAEQVNKAIAQIDAGDYELVDDFDD